ncbi:MAG: TonB-dependent receptor [Proteobacteria bacterium]|nr:TonB-dependent receptor [Pseudomonadota bacterium]
MNGISQAWRLSIAVAICLPPLGSASAQSPQPAVADGCALEEVVVTAERREERIQNVPMSITALGAAQLEADGIRNFQNYAVLVPNLSFAYTSSAAPLGQSISLRGIFGSNTTGVYLDETPVPGSIDPQVIDLERIEVLRGPQGTLYGARSMGGTVRLITSQPDPRNLSGSLHSIGSYTEHGGANGTVDGVVNLPVIADKLAVRAFGFWDDQSGLFRRSASPDSPAPFADRNGIGSSRRYGGSVSARALLLDDALVLTPRVVLQRTQSDGRPYADISPTNFVQSRLFDFNERGSDHWNLYSFTAHYTAPLGKLTSVTSEFDRDYSDSEDASEPISQLLGFTVPSLFQVIGSTRSFVQEFRFTSDFSGPLQVTIGTIYQSAKDKLRVPPNLIADLGDIYSTQIETDTREKAVYGEATLAVTSKLQLTTGLRYFRSNVDFQTTQSGFAVSPGTFGGAQHETSVNPKFNAKYSFNDEVNVFATAAKGFRVGGVNAYSTSLCAADRDALGISEAAAASYKSDSLWSYEVGMKSGWLDKRLIANATVFYIDWSDIQQSVPLACGFSITQNAGKARSQGFELEFQATPMRNLTVGGGVGRTDAKITDGGALKTLPSGQPIQQVPDWTFTTSTDYRFMIGTLPLTAHAGYSYVGSSISRLNLVDGRRRPSYALVNARLAADVGRAAISLFIDNAFNKVANLSDVPPLSLEDPQRPRIAISRPRTVGLDVRMKF